MRRKIRRRRSTKKFMLIASAILMLNLLGITYAHWDDGLNLKAKLSTGNMEIKLLNGHIEIGERRIQIYENKNQECVSIIEIGHNDNIPEAVLFYKIKNKGSIPTKVYLSDWEENLEQIEDSPYVVLEPNESFEGQQRIELNEGMNYVRSNLVFVQK